VPDPIFADPRLAALYDIVDDDRSDLDVYVEIVDELKASTVLDAGCGTGTLACTLARRGIEVIGIDPAAASLDVARRKPGAEHVRWIHGDASSVPRLGVDLAVMKATSPRCPSAPAIGLTRWGR
jgi:ubiquinone/menaquinone biosynthesis C-methylase UbiE